MTLGTYALERIWVYGWADEQGRVVESSKLGEVLKPTRDVEEFLVALLVHDVGHFPFSHYLEASPMVRAELHDHEDVAQQLLDVGSPLHKKLTDRAKGRGLRTVADVCSDPAAKVRLDRVRRLLEKRNTEPTSQLICGPFDLDRLDHYNRDSFFMGIRLSGTHVSGLLTSIVINANPECSRICLREEGMQHALNLLFGREMLWQRAFDSDRNRAYQAMFVRAFEEWATKERVAELPFMSEDELVADLSRWPASAAIMNRILSRQPYPVLYKKEETYLGEKEVIRMFTDWVKKNAGEGDDYLLFLPSSFGESQVSLDWLGADVPVVRDTSTAECEAVPNTGTLGQYHRELLSYFGKQEQARAKTFRVFARTPRLVAEKQAKANRHFSR
jgi:HD superfamily phosphohydrolase